MKNLEKELEDLMRVVEVHGLRKQVVRREFAQLSDVNKRAFVENFQWEVITNTNKNNYQD